MPQMKNSTSSVSGKKNSTSSVSGVENSTSLVSGDAGSNEHGGGIHSDGAVISSFFVNCRVVLLSLLVLAVGLVGGFLLSSKSKTELHQQYMTLENDLSSVRTEGQLSKNKIQLLEQKVWNLEKLGNKIKLLEQKVLTLEKDLHLHIATSCLNTVMYDLRLVTVWTRNEKKKNDDDDKELHEVLGSKHRREAFKSHVQEITKHVNFFFFSINIDEYDIENDIQIVKKFFDTNVLIKESAKKTINQVPDPKNVLCLCSYYDSCKDFGVPQYELTDNSGELRKSDMNEMEKKAKDTGCKTIL